MSNLKSKKSAIEEKEEIVNENVSVVEESGIGQEESTLEEEERTVERKEEESTAEQKEEEQTNELKEEDVQLPKMEQDTIRFTELNESNWKTWSTKLRAYLRLQKLWNVVVNEIPKTEAEKDATWTANDEKALDLITLRVSGNLLGIIGKCVHAHDAYQTLKTHFEGSGHSKVIALLDGFARLKENPPPTIAQFATEYAEIMNEIREMKIEEEEYYGYHFLHLIPEKYQNAATSLKAVGKVTFQTARDFLVQEERMNGTENASLASMNRRTNKKWSKDEAVRRFPCHKCGEFGHFQKDCRNESKKESEEKEPKKKGTQYVLGSMSAPIDNMQESDTSNQIFHDNGANDHLFNKKKWFKCMKPATGSVKLPNGTEMKIEGIGDVHLKENEEVTIVLKNAKFVPEMKSNYVSEFKLMKNNLEIEPKLEKLQVKTKTGKVIATAKRINGLLRYTRLKSTCPTETGSERTNWRKKEESNQTERNFQASSNGINRVILTGRSFE